MQLPADTIAGQMITGSCKWEMMRLVAACHLSGLARPGAGYLYRSKAELNIPNSASYKP